jgi:outer membrane protein assembly factor BamA
VVGLTLTGRFADPIGGAEIPFTELITLGGSEPMEGFVEGRLADRSALVATLQYRWPIWIWLDGAMRAEVGNVFGEHLAGFDMSLMRFSGTLGFASTSSEEGLEMVVGFGTETFDSGGKVNSIRFVVTTHGL